MLPGVDNRQAMFNSIAVSPDPSPGTTEVITKVSSTLMPTWKVSVTAFWESFVTAQWACTCSPNTNWLPPGGGVSKNWVRSAETTSAAFQRSGWVGRRLGRSGTAVLVAVIVTMTVGVGVGVGVGMAVTVGVAGGVTVIVGIRVGVAVAGGAAVAVGIGVAVAGVVCSASPGAPRARVDLRRGRRCFRRRLCDGFGRGARLCWG